MARRRRPVGASPRPAPSRCRSFLRTPVPADKPRHPGPKMSRTDLQNSERSQAMPALLETAAWRLGRGSTNPYWAQRPRSGPRARRPPASLPRTSEQLQHYTSTLPSHQHHLHRRAARIRPGRAQIWAQKPAPPRSRPAEPQACSSKDDHRLEQAHPRPPELHQVAPQQEETAPSDPPAGERARVAAAGTARALPGGARRRRREGRRGQGGGLPEEVGAPRSPMGEATGAREETALRLSMEYTRDNSHFLLVDGATHCEFTL
jgi:hypothetical protein